MSLHNYNEILSLSISEIKDEILKTESEIFNLRFKKATRQTYKSHQFKNQKRKLAQLKTLLTTVTEKNAINQSN